MIQVPLVQHCAAVLHFLMGGQFEWGVQSDFSGRVAGLHLQRLRGCSVAYVPVERGRAAWRSDSPLANCRTVTWANLPTRLRRLAAAREQLRTGTIRPQTFRFSGQVPQREGDAIQVECPDPANLGVLKLERPKRA
jgi:hypothetical protein